MIQSWFICFLSLALPAATASLQIRSETGPVLPENFPDPALISINTVWYVFATNNVGGTQHIQLATSPDFVTWTLTGEDALPNPGSWTTGTATWAPSVIQRPDGLFIMYYSGDTASNPAKHCVGAATSSTVEGPYTAQSSPLICPLSQGGAIDPAGFLDSDGIYYIVYKVDGNSLGHGGACSNDVAPIVPTPIMLQQVENDLLTLVGDPVQILTNDAQDGPDVEAPCLVRSSGGVYFLFYSSNCYTTPNYTVSYATASSITGPYTRHTPLLATGDFGLTAPGGATVGPKGVYMVFHANCPAGRCLHTGQISLSGTTATI